MKRLLLLSLCATLFTLVPARSAQTAGDAKADLEKLVTKVKGKLQAGERTEAALAAELKEFDALLKKHAGQQTDDVAQILVMKAALYAQVFDDLDKALPLFEQVKRDFPETTQGRGADRIIASLKAQAESMRVRKNLVEGKVFPDFDEKDLAGHPLSLARFKGKVVLLDFWATWCGPCVQELPHVKRTYAKYHGQGFEIVGISLDQSRGSLNSFLSREELTWPQYYDGLGWNNKLAKRYGVSSIPATYLIDGDGKIIAKDLRGEALEAAVAKALGK